MTHETLDSPELSLVREVVDRLAARSRRLVFLRALCWFSILILVGAGILATVDYLLQSRSNLLVWFQSGLFLTILTLAMTKIIVPAERFKPGPVDVARRLEQIFPQLQQRLSTVCDLHSRIEELTVIQRQFLNGLADQVYRELTLLELQQCFRLRVLMRPILSVTSILLLVLIVIVSSPQQAATATQRLVMPWNGVHWPRQFELRVVDYRKQVAEGGDYLIQVVNLHGPLPPDLTLELKWQSAEKSELIRLGGEAKVAEFHLNDVLESFKFRLEGGDFHDVGWNKVAVVAAPTIRDSRLTISPPDYTGLETYVGDTLTRALPTSQLSFFALLDNSVVRARLIWDSNGKRSSYPMEINRSGESFGVTLDELGIVESGFFWLEFEDGQGVISQTREFWQIEVEADQAPQAEILKPTSGALLTATGILPLLLRATDDLKVEQLEVVIQVHDSTPESSLRIPLDFSKVLVGTRPLFDSNRVFLKHQPDSVQIECGVDVSLLAGLDVGAELTLSIWVEDQLGNQSTSNAVSLIVSSDRELRGQLTQKIEDLQNRFRFLQGLMRDSVLILQKLRSTEFVNSTVPNLLQQLSLEGINIREVLTGGSMSISARLREVEETLRLTKVEAPLIKESLDGLSQLSKQIMDEHVNPLQASIYQIRNQSEISNDQWLRSLEGIESHLLKAAELIDALLGEQSSDYSRAEFESAWKAFLRQQLDLKTEVSSLATEALMPNVEVNDARIAELTDSQFSLASEVFHLMDQTISEKQMIINSVTQDLAKSVVSDMRQAAANLDNRQFAIGLAKQTEVISTIQSILLEWGIDPEESEQTQDRKARLFIEQLKRLYRMQAELLEVKTVSNLDTLAQRQTDLADNAADLSRQSSVSALIEFGLQDVATLQYQAAEAIVSDDGSQKQCQQEALEMLSVMIGVAAKQLTQETPSDNDTEKRLKSTHSETLSLIRLLQQRLHVEVNPLLQIAELTDEQKQQLDMLVQRQAEIVEALNQIHRTKGEPDDDKGESDVE